MFWKQKECIDMKARRTASDTEIRLRALEKRYDLDMDNLLKRIRLLEDPILAEWNRIKQLEEKIERGYEPYGCNKSDYYTKDQLKKWTQEIADYYAKQAQGFEGEEDK